MGGEGPAHKEAKRMEQLVPDECCCDDIVAAG